MKKWFWLFIVLSIVVIVESIFLIGMLIEPRLRVDLECNLEELLNDFSYDGLIMSEQGAVAVPDAESAAAIGGAIIDHICEEHGRTVLPWEKGSNTSVKYDPNMRLWSVTKGYFMHRGATVLIEQDTGQIINIKFRK